MNGLVSLCGGIGKNSLTHIEFYTGSTIYFTLDNRTQTNLRKLRHSTVEHDTIVTGRLHMGDFDPMSLRCRIDTNLGSIWCDFDIELKDAIFEHLDQLVAAQGTAELDADGLNIRVLHLTEVSEVATAANSKTLDELAREQGVRPIADIRQLQGDPVEDFDTFLQAIRVARGE